MYEAGWAREEIRVAAQGYAMQGYGIWTNRARGWHTKLYARALSLRDADGNALVFCCLDLGYITHAMRAGVVAQLGDAIDESTLVLTCTHTHSGPGGCTHDALYNMVTPGFVPENLAAIVEAAVTAIRRAQATAAPAELRLSGGTFAAEIEVAWNRSLAAYNRNPDVTQRGERETHLALERDMPVLSLWRDGRPAALLSLFGVHATCVGNRSTCYSGDNKGCASLAAEAALQAGGADAPVAIFAQATAGDVSPYYQGPGDVARRARYTLDDEFAWAEENGRRQAELALAAVARGGETLSGPLDGLVSWLDFTQAPVDPRFADGHTDAVTAEPAHGVAFFVGTRVDGPAMPAPIAWVARRLARALRRKRERNLDRLPAAERARVQRLYAAHGPKDILLEAGSKRILGRPLTQLPLPGIVDPLVGELKRQARAGALEKSALVPTVLPLQVVRVGNLALVCCPGEFTTVAGRRVVDTVRAALEGLPVTRVLIVTYCNEYMGYVTTREEYLAQHYEGGHTIFGQWTLAAFQTAFAGLAAQLRRPRAQRTHDTHTRPLPPPAAELALRSALPVPR